jgi:hypothetical protein
MLLSPLTVLLALAAFAAGGKRTPDVVELKDGNKVEGRVVYEDPTLVVVRSGARDREIALKDVTLVRSRAGDLRLLLDRWNHATPSDAAGMMELARTAEGADLVDEARIFAWRALLLDPKQGDAHKLLGHTLRNGIWTVREGSKSFPFANLGEAHKEWKDPWAFGSTHYNVRTNLDLRHSIDMVLELECFYRIFFDVFGPELKLYDVVDPMNAEVHADKQSFPAQVSYRDAYFDAPTNTLFVNAANGLDRRVLFHEATHEILFNTAVRTKGSRGEIPGWLHEGLAEYMAWCMQGSDGHPAFVAGAIAPGHFRIQADARTPFDLARVLNFSSGDFMASSLSDLKYAEAYTLVHFLMHGDGGRHRQGFLDFVRGAYKGQASSTHFRDALGGHERELEAAWVTYVKQTAGGEAPPKASPKR